MRPVVDCHCRTFIADEGRVVRSRVFIQKVRCIAQKTLFKKKAAVSIVGY